VDSFLGGHEAAIGQQREMRGIAAAEEVTQFRTAGTPGTSPVARVGVGCDLPPAGVDDVQHQTIGPQRQIEIGTGNDEREQLARWIRSPI